MDDGSADNCAIANLSLDISTFDCDDIGDNSVVFTAEDGSGNTDSVNVTVTIEDNLIPTAIGQDITIDLAGNPSVSITADDVDDGSFDNCSDVTLSIDLDTFTTVGDFPVVLTVEDEFGSIDSVTVIVTVEDSLGIDDVEMDKIKLEIYPVPTFRILNFESNLEINQVEVYDLLGKQIIVKDKPGNQLNVVNLADGAYFIKFEFSNKRTISKRFVKRN